MKVKSLRWRGRQRLLAAVAMMAQSAIRMLDEGWRMKVKPLRWRGRQRLLAAVAAGMV